MLRQLLPGASLLLLFFLANLAGAATFTNPIDASGQDPWVIQWHGSYYYCWSGGGGVRVSQASRLQDIALTSGTQIWEAPAGQPYSSEIWAPELHFLQGRWYVYFAADDGDNANHRMYVLQSATGDPFSTYTLLGKIAAPSDRWAIDGTVLELTNKLYFIWSGWPATVNTQQNLYIAPMSNPWTISGERVLLSQPQNDWERHGTPYINEGPEVLQHNGKTFVIYSASGSWTDYYCLGLLQLTGANPTAPLAWSKSNAAPVFAKTAKVAGPGHASFVQSLDHAQDWIVYHAAITNGAGWTRSVRTQPFTWNSDGSPHFGTPTPTNAVLTEPSGSPFGITYEAENALLHDVSIVTATSNPYVWSASNTNKVGKIDNADSYVEFTVPVPMGGQHRLYVRYGAGLGQATHQLTINGVNIGTITYPSNAWDNWAWRSTKVVNLVAGTNTIRFTHDTGYAELDFIGVNPGPEGDIDADGLADTWEQTYFGELYNPQGAPDADPDGDGMSNLLEYLAGTNPTNAASAFHVVSIARTNNDVRVQWTAVGGRNYVVQSIPDGFPLATSNFVDVSPVISVAGSGDVSGIYTHIGAGTNQARFYRVRLSP